MWWACGAGIVEGAFVAAMRLQGNDAVPVEAAQVEQTPTVEEADV